MDANWIIAYTAGLLASYLLGSVPFGLIIALTKGVDVRKHGSKNIGSANVGRTLGRKYGVATFALDAAKGFVPVFIGGLALGTMNQPNLASSMSIAWLGIGVAAFLGHLYPIYLRFKGGKGVATGFGALLAVFPVLTFPAVCAIVLWAISVKVTRYIGFSSCIAALSLPIFTLLATPVAKALGIQEMVVVGSERGSSWAPWGVIWPYLAISLFLALFVVVRHRTNLARMLAGTEHRVGETPRSDGTSKPATT